MLTDSGNCVKWDGAKETGTCKAKSLWEKSPEAFCLFVVF
jgi:hypothetical protein